MSNLSIFVFVDSISFKLKNNFLKLDPPRPTIYQLDGNSMRILVDLSDLKQYLCFYANYAKRPKGSLFIPVFSQVPPGSTQSLAYYLCATPCRHQILLTLKLQITVISYLQEHSLYLLIQRRLQRSGTYIKIEIVLHIALGIL